MTEIDDQSNSDVFYDRIADAPYAARGFFESIHEHFRPRNDIDVCFTLTNVADMRLWVIWDSVTGKQKKQVFATMYWQPNNQAVFSRTKLTPEEFGHLGFEGAVIPKSASEPQKSEIRLFEEDWRFGALGFIRALEAAKLKMTAQ